MENATEVQIVAHRNVDGSHSLMINTRNGREFGVAYRLAGPVFTSPGPGAVVTKTLDAQDVARIREFLAAWDNIQPVPHG